MFMVFAIFSGLMLVVGLLVVVLGVKGKRLDRHALCGKCGYDLSGVDVDGEAIVELRGKVCSECGCEVGVRGMGDGVVIGNRERRRWKWVVGCVMILVGLLPGVMMLGVVDVQQYKSNQLLAWEILHPQFSLDVDGATDELIDRFNQLKVGKEVASDLGESILQLGEDEEVVWDQRWGRILFEIHKDGGLDKKQRGRWVEMMTKEWELGRPGRVSPEHLDDVLVWYKLWPCEDYRGWFYDDPKPTTRGGRSYSWMGFIKRVYLDDYVLINRGRDGYSGDMMQRGFHVGGNLFEGSGKRLNEIREEAGKDEFRLVIDFEVEVFSGGGNMSFKHVVKRDMGELLLVDEEPRARLLKDEEKLKRVQRMIRPSGQTRFHTLYVGGPGGRYYEPFTLKGEWFEPERYLSAEEFENEVNRNGRIFERHINFAVVFDIDSRAAKYRLPSLELFSGYEFVEGPMMYEVILRINGKEYEQGMYVGEKRLKARGEQGWRGNGLWLPRGLMRVKGNVGDVILRPAAGYAYRHEHLEEILDGEIVFENVKLLRLDYGEVVQARTQGRSGWIDLRDRAKALMVELGEFESVEAVEAYSEEKREEKLK
ncbi:hypothetical protein JD969_11020 [Planctomycetota bacterium]|nr:hypothetical protein JD969_11020 [Planctomycetota bacterium]